MQLQRRRVRPRPTRLRAFTRRDRLQELQAAPLPVAARRQVATITLNRPERKNPLTFESYAELRDMFRDLVCRRNQDRGDHRRGRQLLLRRRRARNHRPTDRDAAQRRHGRATGVHPHDRRSGQSHARVPTADRRGHRWHLRRRGRDCRDGVGYALRHGGEQSRIPVRARRARRCRHGRLQHAAAHHRRRPRCRAALYRRAWTATEAERWGFYNKLCEGETVLAEAQALAKSMAAGPTFAQRHDQELHPPAVEHGHRRSIEAEAQAQAICMQTKDYERAYEAFVAKQKPAFQGN